MRTIGEIRRFLRTPFQVLAHLKAGPKTLCYETILRLFRQKKKKNCLKTVFVAIRSLLLKAGEHPKVGTQQKLNFNENHKNT